MIPQLDHMIAILNGPVIDEHNTRISYIKRIIEQQDFLGVKRSIRNMDAVCDMTIEELESTDQYLHGLCLAYSENLRLIEQLKRAEGSRP